MNAMEEGVFVVTINHSKSLYKTLVVAHFRGLR